jgi:hypothetical protein
MNDFDLCGGELIEVHYQDATSDDLVIHGVIVDETLNMLYVEQYSRQWDLSVIAPDLVSGQSPTVKYFNPRMIQTKGLRKVDIYNVVFGPDLLLLTVDDFVDPEDNDE